MGILFFSKQPIFSIEIQCRKFTELFFEVFVTHLSYMSQLFFLGEENGESCTKYQVPAAAYLP